jgi:hypothetical protein
MVQGRECQGLTQFELAQCRQQVEIEARSLAQDVALDADQTLRSLRDLFAGLSRIDAPKTLILVSEGFVLSDPATVFELGAMAA